MPEGFDLDSMVRSQLGTYGPQGGSQGGTAAGGGLGGFVNHNTFMFPSGSPMSRPGSLLNRGGQQGASVLSLMPGAISRDVNSMQGAEQQRAGAVQGALGGVNNVLGQTQDLYNSLGQGQANPIDERVQSGDALAQQQLTDFDRLA
jgi:hypothetical protein